MGQSLPEPNKKLAKEIIRIMYIESIIWFIVQAVIIGGLFIINHLYWSKYWLTVILIILTIIAVVNKIIDLILPIFRYRNWRYYADESYLYLKYGALFETRIIVPMTKIQSVKTEQGPLLRKYNLYTVTVTTMGDSHSITGLPKDVALSLRDEIARYAKIKEEGD